MNSWRSLPLLGIVLGCALGQPAWSADVKFADVKLGPIIMGPRIDRADLKGKVVLMELWGIH